MQGQVKAAAVLVASILASEALAQDFSAPQTVTIPPSLHEYLPAGERISAGKSVAARKVTVKFHGPVTIMKYQVSAADYAACVAEGACNPPHQSNNNGPGKPVTGVSFIDAVAYSNWLSRKTSQYWRLPTDEEWTFAAAGKFGGEAIEAVTNNAAPAAAWIANYARIARSEEQKDPDVHAHGKFGANEHGIFDIAGNVWEWTSSCYVRASLDADGEILAMAENCGVRVIEGRHRSYMTYFIQDAASGGCAVGATPDHLGFRLVLALPTFGQFLSGVFSRLADK